MFRVWIYLALAIAAEVAATSTLRTTDRFTAPVPTIAVLVGFLVSFYLLSLVIRDVPLAVAYAVWAGVGTVVVAAIGVFGLGESMSFVRMSGVVCVVVGVVGVNLCGPRTLAAPPVPVGAPENSCDVA